MDLKIAQLIQRYFDGPADLRRAVEGLSEEEIDSIPIPGTWSIRQVVCHIADAEILYADRIKRVVAENEPALMKADPTKFSNALGVKNRNLSDEIKLVEAIRTHVGHILAQLQTDQFERTGIHSDDGPMTLVTILERATDHIPHHLAFLEEKKRKIVEGRR